MSETFKVYFEKLEKLSSEELDRSVAELVMVENRNVALVIAHLAEISRRKAELERGYKNLFAYCVERLGLSEGSVALRLQVANVSRRFPQVLAALAEGRISLTVAGRLAPQLREENVERLLADCRGMTKRAVEEYLVRLSPRPAFAPSIRRLPGAAEGMASRAGSEERKPKAAEQRGDAPRPPEASRPSLPPPFSSPAHSTPTGLLSPATSELYNFRFAAGPEFKTKLERLAEVLGIDNAPKNMAEVLEQALDLALERKDPQRRHERRVERQRRRDAAARLGNAAGSRPDDVARREEIPVVTQPCSRPEMAAREPATSRHIPVAVRDRVLARTGHQCQFTGPEGLRCTARTSLEIEHERPFAIYQSHDELFLRVLCKQHNLLRAEHVYGASYIRRRIDERRLERAPAGHSHSIPIS